MLMAFYESYSLSKYHEIPTIRNEDQLWIYSASFSILQVSDIFFYTTVHVSLSVISRNSTPIKYRITPYIIRNSSLAICSVNDLPRVIINRKLLTCQCFLPDSYQLLKEIWSVIELHFITPRFEFSRLAAVIKCTKTLDQRYKVTLINWLAVHSFSLLPTATNLFLFVYQWVYWQIQ